MTRDTRPLVVMEMLGEVLVYSVRLKGRVRRSWVSSIGKVEEVVVFRRAVGEVRRIAVVVEVEAEVVVRIGGGGGIGVVGELVGWVVLESNSIGGVDVVGEGGEDVVNETSVVEVVVDDEVDSGDELENDEARIGKIEFEKKRGRKLLEELTGRLVLEVCEDAWIALTACGVEGGLELDGRRDLSSSVVDELLNK